LVPYLYLPEFYQSVHHKQNFQFDKEQIVEKFGRCREQILRQTIKQTNQQVYFMRHQHFDLHTSGQDFYCLHKIFLKYIQRLF
jgi:hypothetical protein